MTRRTRLSFETLDDRCLPSFIYGGDYSIDEFYQRASYYDFVSPYGPGVTADFNGDGLDDLFSVSWPGMGDVAVGSVFLGQRDGTFDPEESWSVGGDVVEVGIVEFNGDGRPDLGIVSWNPYVAGGYDVLVLLNSGIWPTTSQLSISGASVTEGNRGTVAAVFTVTLANGPDQPVTVQYATADGSATAGTDYQATSGMLTFAPGETTKTITVLVNGDRLAEGNETFYVDLSDPTNAVLVSTEGRGLILDDEPAVSIAAAVPVTEGNTGTRPASFTVTLSVASDTPVTVNYATADGTATAGKDFQATSGTLTFAPGELSKTVTVPVLGDRLPEPTETFFVNLSGATGASIADGRGVGTVLDDEPRISIGNVSLKEGNGKKTTQFTFTVTLSAAYDQPVTVSYRTADGTATTGDGDYVARTGAITFAPGETTKTITIVVNGDSKREATEDFYLDLFDNSSNSLFTKSRGTGTVLNDD